MLLSQITQIKSQACLNSHLCIVIAGRLIVSALPLKMDGFVSFLGFKKVFCSKGSESTKSCGECIASVVQNSRLEGTLYTGLLNEVTVLARNAQILQVFFLCLFVCFV